MKDKFLSVQLYNYVGDLILPGDGLISLLTQMKDQYTLLVTIITFFANMVLCLSFIIHEILFDGWFISGEEGGKMHVLYWATVGTHVYKLLEPLQASFL